jgi:ubiquinone/menaquinone biosynthesis C-methylase UbiE
MNPNKALWEKGDFTRIAVSMRESGEALVRGLGIKKGLRVLDLGCGDGTTALPAARLGADVLGVDIARNLVEAGNRRAKEQGLTNCKFQEGDATNLHELKDQTFDLVLSIFGAMFAPKPFDVAKEKVRVTRPGGRIIMGNWIPNDPTLVAQILKICSSYSSADYVRQVYKALVQFRVNLCFLPANGFLSFMRPRLRTKARERLLFFRSTV